MQVTWWPDKKVFSLKPCACTLGVFDGVHLGHRRVLDTLVSRARVSGIPSVVITFDPHPAAGTARVAPPLLTPLAERLDLIAQTGVDACLLIRFTAEVASMAAEEFVGRILRDFLCARAVIVGFNTRFGHRRGGSPELLRSLGPSMGFELTVCEPLLVDGQAVSSTRIREELRAGRIASANRLLGRSYRIAGEVVQGDGRGRRLGFPTANLHVEQRLIPATGVYVTVMELDATQFPGVTSISRRETFHDDLDAPEVVETHLLDFAGSLYGRACELHFLKRLRSQEKFPSEDALKAAIRSDVEAARKMFGAGWESGMACDGRSGSAGLPG